MTDSLLKDFDLSIEAIKTHAKDLLRMRDDAQKELDDFLAEVGSIINMKTVSIPKAIKNIETKTNGARKPHPIKSYRIMNEMSQAVFADKFKFSVPTVGRLESGGKANSKSLAKIAKKDKALASKVEKHQG